LFENVVNIKYIHIISTNTILVIITIILVYSKKE